MMKIYFTCVKYLFVCLHLLWLGFLIFFCRPAVQLTFFVSTYLIIPTCVSLTLLNCILFILGLFFFIYLSKPFGGCRLLYMNSSCHHLTLYQKYWLTGRQTQTTFEKSSLLDQSSCQMFGILDSTLIQISLERASGSGYAVKSRGRIFILYQKR